MGKLKRIVLIVAVAVGVGAVGAAGVALRAYDKATKIDRTRQDIVISEYAHAVLTEHDDVRAALFTCAAPGSLDAFRQLGKAVEAADHESGHLTQVTLRSTRVTVDGTAAEVLLELNQGSGIEVRTTVQTWRFTLVDEDGWRVCGAEQIPTPSPSTTPPTAS